jgi:uncharacterized membrane protein
VSDDQKQAIEQLERRVATLENMLRRLTFVANTSEQLRSTLTPAARPAPTPAPSKRVSTNLFPTVKAATGGDLEQWFGQRGLLAVGVAALLIATGLFLKYAFDRGWIPPLVRTVSAVVGGIALAAWGHERILHGMRRYGAAMIGAGGGLVYLGLWAAAGPYALMERRVGILLLVATTIAVTYLAMHHEIEGLAIWALGGAYLAPIILATEPNPLGFLTYLEIIGLGTAITAYAMGWRATFNLAVFGYLLLAAAGATAAITTPLGCWLIAAGAILTLHITRLRSWPETRALALLVAWSILGYGLAAITTSQASRWVALASAVAVWGLLFAQQALRDAFDATAVQGLKIEDLGAERLLFIASPVALLVLANAVGLTLLQQRFEIVPLTLAAAYVTVGWVRRSAAHLITGVMLVAFAMAVPWQARTIVIGWTGLALVALAAEREGTRPGGRHAATALAIAAWVCLFTAAMVERAFSSSDGGVFTGRWALALYVYVAGTAVLARWWGRADKPMMWNWILCGAAVFTGGSILFQDYFSRMTALAGDLALSVWWLLFAGALVFLGFRLNHKLIRSTGLSVAAFVGLKIVLYDLSQMNALYRVGSFFALAIIALAVAYAYNRRAKVSVA